MRRWIVRIAVVLVLTVLAGLFVVVPVGGSFLITNARFRFPEVGREDARQAGLDVEEIAFTTPDGIRLQGWWSPPAQAGRGVIVFVHGLNRSRAEFLERAAAAGRRGYGVLLFDLRNHGQSQDAYTTLGVLESRDVCRAVEWASEQAPSDALHLWGVSMGASAALLAARRCPVAAIIADSSFLSFSETVGHHLGLIFGLPAFPIAPMIVRLTAWRMGFDSADGDVEAAVAALEGVPVLFVAGGDDDRMPPAIAAALHSASPEPASELLVIPGAGHGAAFRTDPERYLSVAFGFLDKVASSR